MVYYKSMKDLSLLLDYNPSKAAKPTVGQAGALVYNNISSKVSVENILSIMRFLNATNHYYSNINIPIEIVLGPTLFSDKLTYTILECLCYNEIRKNNRDVRITLQTPKRGPLITSHGSLSSPLMLLSSPHIEKRREFVKKFQFDIYGTHFRRILYNDYIDDDSLGTFMSDIVCFLKTFDVDEGAAFDIAEVITELMCNAIEHANADVLVDIDIANSYTREGVSYYGMNVVVMNFATETIGHDLRIKMNCLQSEPETLTGRYQTLFSAYKNHKIYFDEFYNEDSFFLLASFQDRISGRMDNNITGGTGLTTLISSLEDRAENHLCYMISGDKKLFFPKECLEIDSDNWIKFCREGSFLTTPPDDQVLFKSPLVFPGVAYNLTFIMRERMKTNEDNTY